MHIVWETMVLRRPKRSVDVAPMTAYEIISIFIGILALLMSFGSLIFVDLTQQNTNEKRMSINLTCVFYDHFLQLV